MDSAAASRASSQTPIFDMDIQGAGELVLSALHRFHRIAEPEIVDDIKPRKVRLRSGARNAGQLAVGEVRNACHGTEAASARDFLERLHFLLDLVQKRKAVVLLAPVTQGEAVNRVERKGGLAAIAAGLSNWRAARAISSAGCGR